MLREFNTTGLCVGNMNYMVNINEKLNKISKLIDHGKYFTINRPRQYGKTTTLNELENMLKGKYLIASMSFEGLGDAIFQQEKSFANVFLKHLARSIKFQDKEASERLKNLYTEVSDLDEVSDVITEFIMNEDKETILFIDEVDKSSNNQLFLSFLGMIRNKYLLRNSGKDYTFKSVILAGVTINNCYVHKRNTEGVYDVKSLKLKLRPNEETKYNSPWNISVDFNIDMSFSPKEIETMLVDYSKDYNLNMDTKSLSERIYFFTSGYPFLVSRICQHIDEKLYNDLKYPWQVQDIDKGVKIILKETNTLFDSLIKNLENNEELMNFIKQILIDANALPFTISDSLINLGVTYGFFKEREGMCVIANRILEQYIYNHLASREARRNLNFSGYNIKNRFITPDKGLDIRLICQRFQQYMKENYSSVDEAFIEREGRLIFLAFIAPIINGVGFAFKEVQISEEKRLDIVITYNNFKYIIELKIWRGQKYHEEGLKQLYDYLSINGLDTGYLVSFNLNKNKEYKEEIISVLDKEIFSVMV